MWLWVKADFSRYLFGDGKATHVRSDCKRLKLGVPQNTCILTHQKGQENISLTSRSVGIWFFWFLGPFAKGTATTMLNRAPKRFAFWKNRKLPRTFAKVMERHCPAQGEKKHVFGCFADLDVSVFFAPI